MHGNEPLPFISLRLQGNFASSFEEDLKDRYEAYAEHDALNAPNGKMRIRLTKAEVLRVGARKLAEQPKRVLRPRDPFRRLSPRLQPLNTARDEAGALRLV